VKPGISAVSAACFALLPAALAAAPSPVEAHPAAASYQFALGKLLAVEGSVADALAAFEEAERLAPEGRETAYVLLEHAQLLARSAQYARNPASRDEALRKAGEKIAAARRLAPDNLDVLRAVGDVYLDLAAGDPAALNTAREALESVRRSHPADAQSIMTLGRIYLDQNQPQKAAEVFRELIDNVPQQRMAYALLVESLLRAGQPAEAEKALQEILTFDPSSLEARLTLADLQGRRGDHRAVLATLHGAPEEARDDPRLKRQTAWALYQTGHLDEALTAVETLAGRDPDSQALALLKGLILAAQGRNDEAIGLLGGVREAQPKDPAVAVTLSRVMQRTGRREEASVMLVGLAETLEREGKVRESQELRLEAAEGYSNAKAWNKVAEVLRPLLASGDEAAHGQAVMLQADAFVQDNRFDEALGLLAGEKESPAVIAKRAEVMARAGREEEAAGLFAGLVGAADEASALAAAQAHQRLERYQSSIPILEKLAAAHPDQAVTGFLLGVAYERTGQRDKGVAEFRRVLELEPDFDAALNYLGYTFAEAGIHLEEALNLATRAVSLDPDNGAYVDSLGWAYFRLGRPEQARSYLERAARLEPEDATLQEHLGDVYVALGQTERARQAYRRAIELGGENAEAVRRKLGDLEKMHRR
jgi:tetratricopeptide (TPR) repeat protein